MINLPANPDTMTVADLKAAAITLRSLLQNLHLLEHIQVGASYRAEETYGYVLGIADNFKAV